MKGIHSYNSKGIKLVPVDPQAKKIGISKKEQESIQDYIDKNKSKLSNIVRMVAEIFTRVTLSRKQGLQDVAKALDGSLRLSIILRHMKEIPYS